LAGVQRFVGIERGVGGGESGRRGGVRGTRALDLQSRERGRRVEVLRCVKGGEGFCWGEEREREREVGELRRGSGL